jgi:hypothetical protein
MLDSALEKQLGSLKAAAEHYHWNQPRGSSS